MLAEQNLAQAFSREESGLRALEFYFLEFLTTLAFELNFRKRSFPREFVDEAEQWFGKFAEACKRNRASVLASACRKIGAQSTQIFFDLPASTLCSSHANHHRDHVGKSGH